MPADRGASVAHTQDALLAENARLRSQLAEAEQRAARLTTQSASGGAFRDAEFMRSVLASSDDCIKVLDLDGNITFMSEGGQRTMEVGDFNAIRGCPWPDFWHGQLNADAKTAVETAKSGGTGRFQGMTETMAGTLKYWDVLVTPICGPDGKPEKLLSVSRDITATRRVEEALGESEARFEAIADSIDQMIWSTRPDGFHDYYNQRWYEYTGVPEGSTDGEAWNDMFHADDQESAWTTWRHSLATGEPYRIEYRLRHRSGRYRWVLGRAQPVRDAEGHITRWYGTCTDIHEIMEAREVLTHSREELERQIEERTRERDRVWQNSRDLLVIVGADGIFRDVNPAWTAVLGHGPAEVVGRSFLDFIWPDDADLTTGGLQPAASKRDLTHFENRYRHKDDTPRWISWQTAAEGELVYAYGRDITALKEQISALQRSEEALRQSQKMEAVGQLTGGLAHDFNNLLAGISGSLELMQTRVAQGRIGDLERYLVAAQGASKRAAALTHRLLAFSRRQTLEPKPTNANRLVTGMEELVRRTVGPHVTVEVVIAGGLWTTLVDPNQLENAVLNLCINARDAMPDGGRLTVETANKWLDECTARQRDVPAGQYVSLSVSDTGTGMTPEVARCAFDPFFTTKPIGMGTGLGLSMIYGFVTQSGGQARIYSEPGHGTTVSLYLPRHDGEAAIEDVGAELAGAPRAVAGETVLVVDDEPTVRMLVTEVLQDLGYTAIEAADGSAGLQVLRSNARIDLLVTDVGLPGGMNGRQVADAGREIRPGLKVLFITGYAENAALSHGHLDPGMRVLTKPFAMEALAGRIKELIAGNQGKSSR